MANRPLQRGFVTIVSHQLETSRDFYQDLLGYGVAFSSDWFVHLQHPDNELLEIGFLSPDAELSAANDLVPEALRVDPTGVMLTLVVADVDAVHEQATSSGVDIIESPRNLFYGQRRMLVRDPNGLVLDVSSECPPDPDWVATLTG